MGKSSCDLTLGCSKTSQELGTASFPTPISSRGAVKETSKHKQTTVRKGTHNGSKDTSKDIPVKG